MFCNEMNVSVLFTPPGGMKICLVNGMSVNIGNVVA